ncbi:hypothetical protein HN011_001564 [Eciton burchellii]|nr:hypothetical protein HN011_001564 [Eciton burchellii]
MKLLNFTHANPEAGLKGAYIQPAGKSSQGQLKSTRSKTISHNAHREIIGKKPIATAFSLEASILASIERFRFDLANQDASQRDCYHSGSYPLLMYSDATERRAGGRGRAGGPCGTEQATRRFQRDRVVHTDHAALYASVRIPESGRTEICACLHASPAAFRRRLQA